MAKPNDVSITQLEEVFATFNRVSAELGSSYRELESRVTGLSEELAATHSARIKELTEKEQLAVKLSTLMAALPGGVVTLDANGIIKDENPAAIQILGSSNQGSSWLQVLENSASTGSVLKGEISFQNGKRISISSSVYGDAGDTILLLNDVSENYHLNNIVNREKRLAALGEMAARLAHQVRTPLSSAILYLSHLSPLANNDTLASVTVQKILNRLRQIERLIDGMLSYIRGDINSNEEFSLNELLKEVRDAALLQVETAKGTIKFANPKQSFSMRGNKEALFNALSNLVENSIQAVKNKPSISLNLSNVNDFYKISVTDNGPGIKDSIKEQVFDPFFSTRAMGNGLGLAVVLSAVKAHNGEVFIKTPAKGGTVFEIMIPVEMDTNAEGSGIWGSNSHNIFHSDTPAIGN